MIKRGAVWSLSRAVDAVDGLDLAEKEKIRYPNADALLALP